MYESVLSLLLKPLYADGPNDKHEQEKMKE